MAMTTPQPSRCGCWPAIQPPHATTATVATNAALSAPSHSHNGYLLAQSTAFRETLLFVRSHNVGGRNGVVRASCFGDKECAGTVRGKEQCEGEEGERLAATTTI